MPAADPRAHGAVMQAIRKGILVRPEICEDCGAKAKLDAHHADYAKPLEVRWLCRKCHRRQPVAKNRRDDLGYTAIGLRLDEEMLAQLDARRGDVPRERFIRRALSTVFIGDGAFEVRRNAEGYVQSVAPVTSLPVDSGELLKWGGVGGKPPVEKRAKR